MSDIFKPSEVMVNADRPGDFGELEVPEVEGLDQKLPVGLQPVEAPKPIELPTQEIQEEVKPFWSDDEYKKPITEEQKAKGSYLKQMRYNLTEDEMDDFVDKHWDGVGSKDEYSSNIRLPLMMKTLGFADDKAGDENTQYAFMQNAVGLMGTQDDNGNVAPYVMPITSSGRKQFTEDFLKMQDAQNKTMGVAKSFGVALAMNPSSLSDPEYRKKMEESLGDAKKYPWFNAVVSKAISEGKQTIAGMKNDPLVKKYVDAISKGKGIQGSVRQVDFAYSLQELFYDDDGVRLNDAQALTRARDVVNTLLYAEGMSDKLKNAKSGTWAGSVTMGTVEGMYDMIRNGINSLQTLKEKTFSDLTDDEKLLLELRDHIGGLTSGTEIGRYDSSLDEVTQAVGGSLPYMMLGGVGVKGVQGLMATTKAGASTASVLGSLASNATLTAVSATAMLGGTAQQEYNSMLIENPDADKSKLAVIAGLSSGIQTAIEYVQVAPIIGWFPKANSTLSKIPLIGSQFKSAVFDISKGRALKASVREVAKETVSNYLEEVAQGITTPILMDITNALYEDMPEVDWNDELKGLKEQSFSTAMVSLTYSMLGAKARYAKGASDFACVKTSLEALTVDDLIGMGIDDKTAYEIKTAEDIQSQADLFATGWETRNRDVQKTNLNAEQQMMYDLVKNSMHNITGKTEVEDEDIDTAIDNLADTSFKPFSVKSVVDTMSKRSDGKKVVRSFKNVQEAIDSADVNDDITRQLQEDPNAAGFYDPNTGETFIFEDEMNEVYGDEDISTEEVANRLFNHEVGVHSEVDRTREHTKPFFQQVQNLYGKEIQAQYGEQFDLSTEEGMASATEEFVAEMGEKITFDKDGKAQLRTDAGNRTAFGEIVKRIKQKVKEVNAKVTEQQIADQVGQYIKQAEKGKKARVKKVVGRKKGKRKSTLNAKTSLRQLFKDFDTVQKSDGRSKVAKDAKARLVKALGADQVKEALKAKTLKSSSALREQIKTVYGDEVVTMNTNYASKRYAVSHQFNKRANQTMQDSKVSNHDKIGYIINGDNMMPEQELIEYLKDDAVLANLERILTNKGQSTDADTRASVKDMIETIQDITGNKEWGSKIEIKERNKRGLNERSAPTVPVYDVLFQLGYANTSIMETMDTEEGEIQAVLDTEGREAMRKFSQDVTKLYDDQEGILRLVDSIIDENDDPQVIKELLYQLSWSNPFDVKDVEKRAEFDRARVKIRDIADTIGDMDKPEAGTEAHVMYQQRLGDHLAKAIHVRALNAEQTTKKGYLTLLDRILNRKKYIRPDKDYNPVVKDGEEPRMEDQDLYYHFVRKSVKMSKTQVDDRKQELMEFFDNIKETDYQRNRKAFIALSELMALNEFGGLKYQTAEEVKSKVESLEAEMERQATFLEAQLTAKKEETKGYIKLLTSAVESSKTNRDTFSAKVRDTLTKLLGIKHRLEHLTWNASDEAKAYIDRVVYRVNEATGKSNFYTADKLEAFGVMIDSVFGKGKGHSALVKMNQQNKAYAKYSRNGAERMSKAQVLQLYVTLRQADYAYLSMSPEQVEAEIARMKENLAEGEVFNMESKSVTKLGKYYGVMEDIEANVLNKEDKVLLKNMADTYRSMLSEINEVAEAEYGFRVLSADDNYFPAVFKHYSAGQLESMSGGMSMLPGFMKVRTSHDGKVDEGVSIFNLAQSHFREVGNFIGFGSLKEELRKTFGSKEFQEAYEDKFGKDASKLLLGKITDTVNGGFIGGNINRDGGNLVNFYLASKIAGNARVAFRQWSSLTSGMLEHTMMDTGKYILSTWTAEGREAMGELLGSEQAKYRMSVGAQEEVSRLMTSKNLADSAVKKAFANAMILNKWGDMGSLLPMAQGIYRARTADYVGQNMSIKEAKERAMIDTWAEVEMYQQSSQVKDQSDYLSRGGVPSKMFAAFTNTPRQYLAYEITAYRRVLSNPKSKDAWNQLARVTVHNHMVAPSLFVGLDLLYQMMFGEEPDKDDLIKWITSMVLGSTGGLFILGGVIAGFTEGIVNGRMRQNLTPVAGTIQDGVKLFNAVKSVVTVDDNMMKDWDKFLDSASPAYRDLSKAYVKLNGDN